MSTGATTCADCGARYEDADDSCARRFERLLALDHSRQEPWGSRHGLAFAAYALQHPGLHDGSTRLRSLEMLERIYVKGEAPEYVIRTLRASVRDGTREPASAPPPPAGPFDVTIAALGAFEAGSYAAQLDGWCRDTLARYGSRSA